MKKQLLPFIPIKPGNPSTPLSPPKNINVIDMQETIKEAFTYVRQACQEHPVNRFVQEDPI